MEAGAGLRGTNTGLVAGPSGGQLHLEIHAEGETGDVVITGEVQTEHWDGGQNVKVRLTRDRYDHAVQAHRLRRIVRLVGVAFRGTVASVFQMKVEES